MFRLEWSSCERERVDGDHSLTLAATIIGNLGRAFWRGFVKCPGACSGDVYSIEFENSTTLLLGIGHRTSHFFGDSFLS